jgi:UPF0755 protein
MENLPNENVQHRVFDIYKIDKSFLSAIILIVLLSFSYFLLFSPPENFPVGAVINIDSGMSLRSISAILKKEHVIRSRVVFEYSIIILGGEKHIISADYSFEKKISVWQVVSRIAGGEHRMAPVSITIPEGFDLNQIGEICISKLANFNKNQFLLETKGLEGYLFPDTYFFLNNTNEEDVIKSMNGNFTKKIAFLLPKINSSGKTEKEIITMASIIEREAKGDSDRGVISGILWKRIKLGMPLEVDSAPETYKIKGLPEDPIDNPGLKAIEAAIDPQDLPYLYYLHDKNGDIHYATTFMEHQKNIKEYLK